MNLKNELGAAVVALTVLTAPSMTRAQELTTSLLLLRSQKGVE